MGCLAAALAAPVAWALTHAALHPGWKLALAAGAALGLLSGPWRGAGAQGVALALWLPGGQWQLCTGTGPAALPASLRRSWGERHGPVLALEWACADGRARRAWLTRLDMPPRTWRRLRARLAMA